jgi:hypothetical protein
MFFFTLGPLKTREFSTIVATDFATFHIPIMSGKDVHAMYWCCSEELWLKFLLEFGLPPPHVCFHLLPFLHPLSFYALKQETNIVRYTTIEAEGGKFYQCLLTELFEVFSFTFSPKIH